MADEWLEMVKFRKVALYVAGGGCGVKGVRKSLQLPESNLLPAFMRASR